MRNGLAVEETYITVEEYLAIDERSKYRQEYFDGEVYQMAGAKFTHNLISSNILRRLGDEFEDKNCDVVSSDLRVKVDETHYFYPDIVVVCNPQFTTDIFDTLENPTVVVEITSKSTASRDHDEKRLAYLQLESLNDYLIVSQKEIRIEHYSRKTKDEWSYKFYESNDQIISLKSLEVTITVGQIYRKIEFPPKKLKLVRKRK
jgi:Uma2 family endonuclease